MPVDPMQPTAGNVAPGLGQRTAIGAAWLLGAQWLSRAIGMISIIVLARLLMPEDFGLVALATTYIAIVQGVTAMPMGQALIRFRDAGRAMYDTAWTLNALRGLAIALVMVASAAPVAALMDEPRLEAVVYVLALTPLLGGLNNIRWIDYEKNLTFSRPAIVGVALQIVGVVITVAAAVTFRTYWALVIGQLAGAVIGLVVKYVLLPYLPRPTFAETRALFGFSGWLTGSSLVSTLNMRLDNVWLGAMLDTKTVGLYYMGNQLANMPLAEISRPLMRVLYPGFAKIIDNTKQLRATVLEASSIVAAVALPLSFGFAVVSPDVIRVLIGEKWLGVVPVVQILCPVIGLQLIGNLGAVVAMAKGSTKKIFTRDLVYFGIRNVLVVPGIFLYGMIGAVIARAISGLIFSVISLALLGGITGMAWYRPLLTAWRSLLSTLLMVLAVLYTQRLHGSAPTNFMPAVDLAIDVGVGAVVYLVSHVALWLLAGRPAGAESRMLEFTHSALHAIHRRRLSA